MATLIHIYQGYCPDQIQPDSRDPNCPVCAMEAENAKLRAELEAARELVKCIYDNIDIGSVAYILEDTFEAMRKFVKAQS